MMGHRQWLNRRWVCGDLGKSMTKQSTFAVYLDVSRCQMSDWGHHRDVHAKEPAPAIPSQKSKRERFGYSPHAPGLKPSARLYRKRAQLWHGWCWQDGNQCCCYCYPRCSGCGWPSAGSSGCCSNCPREAHVFQGMRAFTGEPSAQNGSYQPPAKRVWLGCRNSMVFPQFPVPLSGW